MIKRFFPRATHIDGAGEVGSPESEGHVCRAVVFEHEFLHVWQALRELLKAQLQGQERDELDHCVLALERQVTEG